MKRSEVVIEGARSLFATELAIDHAYGQTAGLASRLIELRVAGGVSAVIGQEALDEVSEALSDLNRARAKIVRAHGKLDGVKTQLGCRTVATGGMDKDNPEVAPRAEVDPLAAAA